MPNTMYESDTSLQFVLDRSSGEHSCRQLVNYGKRNQTKRWWKAKIQTSSKENVSRDGDHMYTIKFTGNGFSPHILSFIHIHTNACTPTHTHIHTPMQPPHTHTHPYITFVRKSLCMHRQSRTPRTI